MTIAEKLLAEFEQEAKVTRTFLAACPEDRFGWKPHAKSMTLAQLAGHLTESGIWGPWMETEELDFATLDFQPFVPETSAQLLERFDDEERRFLATFRGRDDAFLRATWTMRAGDRVFLSEPREAAVRNMVLSHAIHHRGQLSVYLRLLDVPVPSAYGPTADVPMG